MTKAIFDAVKKGDIENVKAELSRLGVAIAYL